jgi:hypothetical protein
MVTRRTDAANDDELILLGAAVSLAVVAVGGIWLVVYVATWLETGTPYGRNPAQLIADLVTGRQLWTTTATVLAVALVLFLAAAVWLVIAKWPRRRKMRPDRAARYMAAPADLGHLTRAGAAM